MFIKENSYKILKKNKKLNPFFSVITVVKNSEKNIIKTVKSVINQSFKDYEFIVIDGKSTDQTLDKLRNFRNQIDILVSEKDKGIYFAMNKGIKQANGNVILFLNSGDTLTIKALEIVYKIFMKNNQIDFVFGTVLRNYTKSKVLKYGFNKNKLIYNFDFATTHSAGFFLKKKKYNLIGNFNTKYKCSADYDVYLKILIKYNLIGGSTSKSQRIGNVAAGGFSSKISFFEHLKEEIQIRYDNKQNIILLFLIFINALVKNILKKII